MTRPDVDLARVRIATDRLLDGLAGLTDAQARQPSRLPGWTVGHVLTHLARNADSHVRRARAALTGEVVEQYPGGFAGRAADIEAGAGRPAAALVDDVRSTAAAADAAWAEVPAAAWSAESRDVGGRVRPLSALPARRWREVEIHHADLGLGFTWADWSDELIEAELPRLLAGLPGRADGRQLVAWLLGRAGVPEVAPWE
jgi:maleylpyruvate isomerase